MQFERDYYEIRLESIGGLGANLAGKLLGEVGALHIGLNASSFASYGSEKRGSPVTSYIRYADINTPIRVNSPIEEPDLLGIFHMGLAGKPMVMAGVNEKTKVIVNTELEPDMARDRLRMNSGEIYCIDALKLAMEHKTRINMVMLGAISRASGFIELEKMIEAVSETLGKKYPEILEKNIKGIKAGYENVKIEKFKDNQKYPYEEYKEIERKWGYNNAPIGGINPIFGSTISNDLSSSREGMIPIFEKEKCINCGFCDTACPDFVYQFKKGEYKGKETMVNLGPDYSHCKGCMRCVEVCPTSAITDGYERDSEEKIRKTNIKNIDLIRDNFEYDDVGANSWVESVSYTTNELK